MEIRAELNYLRMSPRKVRLVANLVRGMNTSRAEVELRHLPKRSSVPLLKLLRSAISNAKHNFQLDGSGLFIKDIKVNQGPVLKRFRARAFGRASEIKKKSSHVILLLGTKTEGELSVKSVKQKVKPMIREATAEDLEEKKGTDRKEEKQEIGAKRPKTPGFARRMFRRKAI